MVWVISTPTSSPDFEASFEPGLRDALGASQAVPGMAWRRPGPSGARPGGVLGEFEATWRRPGGVQEGSGRGPGAELGSFRMKLVASLVLDRPKCPKRYACRRFGVLGPYRTWRDLDQGGPVFDLSFEGSYQFLSIYLAS